MENAANLPIRKLWYSIVTNTLYP